MNENQKPDKNRQKSVRLNYFLLIELGIEFAIVLALPLIGAVYLGKWLDAKYGTNFIIIITVLTALILSWYQIFKKIKEVAARFRGNNRQK